MTAEASSLAARVAAVRDRVARASERAGRDPSSVTLIAVSKTHPASVVEAAIGCGLTDLGENRVQEGCGKAEALACAAPRPTWHLIGHLQTNKVRAAVNTFAILHSIDSERLALAVNAATERPIRCFVEVNVAGEATKEGVSPAAAAGLVAAVRSLPNLQLEGLMTVAPRSPDPESVRPIFRELAAMARDCGLPSLSMGMTDDFEVAIEEGATHVRVGRAIFGDRAI